MNRDRLPGIAAVLVTSLLWGTTGTAATFAPGVSPLAIGAVALGVGGLLQALIALPALRHALPQLRASWGVVLVGAVSVGIYPLAFYPSMSLAGVAVGSVVSLASAPVFSGLLERLVDKRRLGPWWGLAVGLGATGCVLLFAARSQSSTSDAMPAGIALGLVAGLTYATYSWAVQRLMARGVARPAAMGSIFGGGGLLLMPVLFVTGAPLVAGWQPFLVAAYLALVPMFLGYLLFGFGLTKVAASTATTITLEEPAVATVLAVLIVGERLAPLGWLGLALFAVVILILALAPAAGEPVRDAAGGLPLPQ